MIVIAMLIDWLKNLAPVFQPMRSKAEPIAPCTCNFSCTLRRLQIITRNSDKFTMVFAPVVIGRSYYFESFSTII